MLLVVVAKRLEANFKYVIVGKCFKNLCYSHLDEFEVLKAKVRDTIIILMSLSVKEAEFMTIYSL